MNAAKIAKLVEHIRWICEEAYNSEKPMQYAEMARIEQLCDEIEKEAHEWTGVLTMADLINRDHAAQAIEAYLCNQCDHDTDCDHECIACPHLDGAEILKSVPAVNRWIPCSERFPENRERVLVCFRSGTVHIAVWWGDYDEKGAWKVTSQFPTKLYRTDTIPKWMPMPDAYVPPERGAEE